MQKQPTRSKVRRDSTRLRTGATALVLLSFSALATPTDLADGLKRCAGLDTDVARLACVNLLINDTSEVTANALPVTAEKAEATYVAPASKKASVPQDAERTGEWSAIITGFEKNNAGWYTFTLDNGDVWRQIDATRAPLRLTSANLQVKFKSGAFNSHRMYIEGRSAMVRVRRID